MGSAGKNLGKSRSVRRSLYDKRLTRLKELVLNGTLEREFKRSVLSTLGERLFTPNVTQEFINDAVANGHVVETTGMRSANLRRYSVVFQPLELVPDAVRDLCTDDRRCADMVKLLLDLDAEAQAYPRGIIHDAICDTTAVETLDPKASKAVIGELVERALLLPVGDEGYRFTDRALRIAGVSTEDSPAPEPPAREQDPAPPTVTPTDPPAEPAPELPAPPPQLSARTMKRLEQLFREVGYEMFRTKANDRANALGYPTPSAFTQALMKACKAGYLESHGRGKWAFIDGAVPSLWTHTRILDPDKATDGMPLLSPAQQIAARILERYLDDLDLDEKMAVISEITAAVESEFVEEME